MKKTILFFSILLCNGLVSQSKTEKSIEGIQVTKQQNADKILASVLSNISKNYAKNDGLFLDVQQESLKDQDTILAFDGRIKYTTPNYSKFHHYIFRNHSLGFICSSSVKKINRQQYTEWFPSMMGKLSKDRIGESPNGRIPFFITRALYLVAIKRHPLIEHLDKFKTEVTTEHPDFWRISFTPKHETMPLSGYMIIEKKTFAITEVKYFNTGLLNTLYYDLDRPPTNLNLGILHYEEDQQHETIDLIDVHVVYKKNKDTNKYSLSSFEAKSSFKQNGLPYQYKSYSKINTVINPTNECNNQKISLTDLGLIFKSNLKKQNPNPSNLSKFFEYKEEE